MNNQYPEWYQSSAGPGVSQTITGILGNLIPVLNLVLASKGINIMPESINPYVSAGVFIFFSVRAVTGYLKAKKALGNRISVLEARLESSNMQG